LLLVRKNKVAGKIFIILYQNKHTSLEPSESFYSYKVISNNQIKSHPEVNVKASLSLKRK
jgi:hypothetical protein